MMTLVWALAIAGGFLNAILALNHGNYYAAFGWLAAGVNAVGAVYYRRT